MEQTEKIKCKINLPPHKKASDEHYTPKAIYEAVLRWVSQYQSLEGITIVRPFYPGGDYQNYDYPDNCIVIDNPPFSILAQIRRFYIDRDIKYFLFGQYTTLFTPHLSDTKIAVNTAITYESGLTVSTSFYTNMDAFVDSEVILAPSLKTMIEDAVPKQKKGAPKYYYDDHVLNINTITTLLRKNMSDCKIPKDEVYAIKALDSQKNKKKRMYGGGYLVSDKISSMLKDKRDRIKQLSADYTFPLSEREKQIVEHINKRKK